MPSNNSLHRLLTCVFVVLLIVVSAYIAITSYTYARINYEKGQLYISDEIYYVDSARRYLEFIFHVDVNDSLYSNKTNNDYFNLEHPPLGKYIIALSIILYGDNPLGWRFPGIIEAGLIPVVMGIAFYRSSSDKLTGFIAGVTTVSALAAEKLLSISGSVAMLDIHLTFFTALTIALLALGKRRWALVAGALALATKLSGAAAILTVILYDIYRSGTLTLKLKRISEAILVSTIIYILLMIPLIIYFGPVDIVEETLGALRWHTTSRPPGPPTSTPIGWIMNSNPFYYSFYPIVEAATLNTILHIVTLIILTPLVYISAKRNIEGGLAGPLGYISVLAIYALVWVLGNKTLYSFYSVQLIPPMAASLGGLVLIGDRR